VVGGVYPNVAAAQAKMTGIKPKTYTPDAKRHAVYDELYRLYRQLHDAFGTREYAGSLANVMKDLLAIRDKARGIGC
jgi:L-ribulokinase